jgi:hypothetical protein
LDILTPRPEDRYWIGSNLTDSEIVMPPFARALAVASTAVLLAAAGGDVATVARGPEPAGLSATRPQLTASDIWGYGVVRHGSSNYTLAGKDGKNSAGTVNSVERFSAGEYAVHLPDLNVGALNAGTALVTTVGGNGNHLCLVDDFGWHTPDPAEIDVRCYNRSGVLTDGTYSASLLDSQSLTGKSGYVWANDPTQPATYIPDVSYQYNSTGAQNSITRLSKGRYDVDFPGLATARGNVQIASRFTAVSEKPALCRALGWGPSATDLVVNVQCRNLSGAKADAQFDLFFGQGEGLKGNGHVPVAYLDANQPTTASYTPDPQRRYSSVGAVSHVTRSGVGRYLVTLAGMPKGGAAQVTPYGTGTSFCVLSSIRTVGTPQQVGVSCFKLNGDRVDSEFGLSYQR